jgi:hypothetical protein
MGKQSNRHRQEVKEGRRAHQNNGTSCSEFNPGGLRRNTSNNTYLPRSLRKETGLNFISQLSQKVKSDPTYKKKLSKFPAFSLIEHLL